ncbi:MAG: hypothetical protein P4L92_23690 [Rudaea sp.]|nr:hypothetical protein [Rudaea sp.]
MNRKFARLALAAAIAVLAAGCGQSETTAPGASAPMAAVAAPSTPDGAISATVTALRANNVGAFLQNALPAAELARMKADWTKEVNKDPVTEDDRKQFADTMTKLTAPGAEDKLYAEIEPQLKEFDQKTAQQMPMMIAMGQGFAQSAIQQSKDLNDQQKQQTQALIDATAKWAQTVKFTDPTLVKGAIAAACKTARDLNLKSIDEARALSYDQAMQKAGVVLGGAKQVFAIYGLNMDKALDSVKVETASANGDTAKVKVSYVAFDQPFSTESDLVKVDGKWYGKQAIDQWNKHQQEEAAKTANPATPEVAADKQGENKG